MIMLKITRPRCWPVCGIWLSRAGTRIWGRRAYTRPRGGGKNRYGASSRRAKLPSPAQRLLYARDGNCSLVLLSRHFALPVQHRDARAQASQVGAGAAGVCPAVQPLIRCPWSGVLIRR